VRGRIEPRGVAEAVGLRRDDVGPELEVPEHVELAARVVIVEADESNERRVVALPHDGVIDEPLSVPGVHDLALGRQAIRSRGWRPCRCRPRVEPRRFQQERLEIGAGPSGGIEAVASADRP